MSRLELRNTDDGPRYYVDDKLLTNGDTIEVESTLAVSDTGRIRGRFLWTGEIGDQPYIHTSTHAEIIQGSAAVRLVNSVPTVKRRPGNSRGKPTVKPRKR